MLTECHDSHGNVEHQSRNHQRIVPSEWHAIQSSRNYSHGKRDNFQHKECSTNAKKNMTSIFGVIVRRKWSLRKGDCVVRALHGDNN